MSPSKKSDGGRPTQATSAEDIFNQVSGVEEPPFNERLEAFLQNHVVTPATIILTDVRGIVGVLLLTFFALMATVAISIFPKPTTMGADFWLPAFHSLQYPLGTGKLGQEIHLQIIHATPNMLKFVISGAVTATVVGTTFGVLAGYKGGRADYFIMLVSDTWMAIPYLVLIIVMATIYRPRSPLVVGFILGINFWGGLARAVRSEVLSIRESNTIEAARVMGLSTTYILRKYIIRNLMPYLTVNFAANARKIIYAAVGLYFIGVLPYTNLNWGVMMNQAYNTANLADPGQIHWLIAPLMMMILLSLGLILTAQAADQIFNVRLVARQKADEDEATTAMPE